ncbi:MAG: hypothetical protein RI897_410 [Verrucomicrobiota bacterium]|jgi:hypothetical protein
MNYRMPSLLQSLPGVLLLAACTLLQAAEMSPLPPADEVKQRLANRMASSQEEKQQFEEHYRYTRTRTRVERNTKGKVKENTEEIHEHQPDRAGESTKGRTPRYGEKDVEIDEQLLDRFKFEVHGRENLREQEVLKVSFKPSSDDLPGHSTVDRFINRTAGTLWLEESSMALVKAQLHLVEPVEFLAGIAGVVYSLNMDFDRSRTQEGDWYPSRSRWTADYRTFLVRKVVDFEETRTDVEHMAGPRQQTAVQLPASR